MEKLELINLEFFALEKKIHFVFYTVLLKTDFEFFWKKILNLFRWCTAVCRK